MAGKPNNIKATKWGYQFVRLSLMVTLIFVGIRCSKPTNTTKIPPTADSTSVRDNEVKIETHRIADSLFDIDKLREAIPFYEKASGYYTNHQLPTENSRCIINWARCYTLLQQYDSAKAIFANAYQYVSKEQENLILADLYLYEGVNFSYNLDIENADSNFNAALSIYKANSGSESEKVIKCYNRLGQLKLWVEKNYNEAESYYIKALSLIENSAKVDTNSLFLIYYGLASTSRKKRDFMKAVSYGNKANDLAQSGNNHLVFSGLCSYMLGIIQGGVGETEKALKHFSDAIDKYNRCSHLYKYLLSTPYMNIGFQYLNEHRYDKALIAFNKSLECLEKFAPYDSSRIAYTYDHIGVSYGKIGEFELAENILSKSLAIKLKINSTPLKISNTYIHTAKVHLAQSHLNEAKQYYKKAIDMAFPNLTAKNKLKSLNANSIGPNNFIISEILKGVTEINHKNFRINPSSIDLLKENLHYYCLLDTLLSQAKANYLFEQSQLLLARDRQDINESAINTAFLLHQYDTSGNYLEIVNHFIEQSKAQLLYENIRKAELQNRVGIDESLKIKEIEYATNIKLYSTKLQTTQAKDSNKIRNYKQLLVSNTQKLDILREKLIQKHPEYYKIMFSGDGVLIAQLENWAAKNNAGIINYYMGKEQVYALYLSETDRKLIATPNNEQLQYHIHNYLDHVRGQIAKPYCETEFQNFCKSAHFLYEKLLAPIASGIEGREPPSKLMVIPDGDLHNIPFEALLLRLPRENRVDYKNLDYLLKKSTVSYVYSAGLLLENETIKNNRIKNALVMAYNINPKVAFRSKGKKLSKSEELNTIKQLTQTKYLLEKKATLEKFYKNAANFDMLHLSMHGEAEQKDVNQSKLIFFPSNKNITHTLTETDAYNFKINARFVVLGACETGIGKHYSGEGTYSIARAFTYSGCPTTIMSLWQIKNKAGEKVLSTFYKTIKQEKELNLALTKSKIEYIHAADELSSHPSNWACFVLIGKTDALHFSKNHTILRLSLSIGLVLILFVCIQKIIRKKLRSN